MEFQPFRRRLAKSEEEAVRRAEEIGYPVVLKIHSETITHKTEVDGVKLNLAGAEDVRSAYRTIESSVIAKAGRDAFLGVTVQPMIRSQGYELILGSSVDLAIRSSDSVRFGRTARGSVSRSSTRSSPAQHHPGACGSWNRPESIRL